ncbi:CubicO group peptidase (beta-lactamase class C family) [Seonamhaeicola aphaedonensis]|uniref:CubicO group peptidase (Beta-lactamase class C family) n=2 Tax=Seonamhaeicola aphaedonensis TaxID=1461338 RepID=A0A3D9H2V8_9FLAO|nr:CubicO group peptidase (beta-lactamase class C family) [Seonamhaeicola aphaedonensis]
MNEDIQNILKTEHNAPAFHYLFFNSDSVIKEVLHGCRNVEEKVDVDSQTSFHAFSVTKTFTAVAVMQLVEEGKIMLEDPIIKYLPNCRFSNPVTIKDLLCHQSGIGNPLPLKWTHLAHEHIDFDYRKFSDSIIMNHLKLKRAPGKKYAYSNINYLVLGGLIEEMSGKEYQAYIADNILNQLPTKEYIGFDIPKSNHANGYHANTWFQNLVLGFLLDKSKMMYQADEDWNGFHPFYNNGAPYGGIISTPNALRVFCQELLKNNGKLLSQSSIDKMLTEQLTLSGKNTGMSLGWFKGTFNEKDYYCHAGGGGGYYSEIRIYPSLGLGSVIMTNSSGMADDRILDQLDRQYLINIK